ncbi:two-component sensor histidine kinase [Thalassotalea profundi]|uniref:histidine kinase n=2 Tax=Thalassotalea profundi TaxID=2036687 RepID=A0ABQ3IFX1_9GAMM|nr:two-component sensor histidine kinase [Thalassotalea profundi]
MEQLDNLFDQELISIANVLVNAKPNANTTNQERSLFYQVIENKTVISRSAIAPNEVFTSTNSDFFHFTYNAQRWRSYSLKVDDLLIIVARPIAQRIQSAEIVLYKAIFPIVITIPFIALIIFYVIRKSLKPLRNLSNNLQAKEINELSPVNVDHNVKELKPIELTLNRLFKRLNSAFEREQQLATNAAHELRTPISVLNITTHNLIEAYAENGITYENLKELKNNVERMTQVTEQIIALYRFSPEYFNEKLIPINVEHLLQQVIANNYRDITKATQNISLESIPLMVLGDEFSLVTLFENLLKNSIKYAGAKSEILISTVLKHNLVIITLEDSGAGLTKEQRKMMFDRFYRANEDTTRVKGSGLGLSIAKHIVELHNGTITGERSSLGGLNVIVTLPHYFKGDSHVE